MYLISLNIRFGINNETFFVEFIIWNIDIKNINKNFFNNFNSRIIFIIELSVFLIKFFVISAFNKFKFYIYNKYSYNFLYKL